MSSLFCPPLLKILKIHRRNKDQNKDENQNMHSQFLPRKFLASISINILFVTAQELFKLPSCAVRFLLSSFSLQLHRLK